jgi:hypothetical protein
MHLKEIGKSYDAIAHIWREDRIQSNGISQVERPIRFARIAALPLISAAGAAAASSM